MSDVFTVDGGTTEHSSWGVCVCPHLSSFYQQSGSCGAQQKGLQRTEGWEVGARVRELVGVVRVQNLKVCMTIKAANLQV